MTKNMTKNMMKNMTMMQKNNILHKCFSRDLAVLLCVSVDSIEPALYL